MDWLSSTFDAVCTDGKTKRLPSGIPQLQRTQSVTEPLEVESRDGADSARAGAAPDGPGTTHRISDSAPWGRWAGRSALRRGQRLIGTPRRGVIALDVRGVWPARAAEVGPLGLLAGVSVTRRIAALGHQPGQKAPDAAAPGMRAAGPLKVLAAVAAPDEIARGHRHRRHVPQPGSSAPPPPARSCPRSTTNGRPATGATCPKNSWPSSALRSRHCTPTTSRRLPSRLRSRHSANRHNRQDSRAAIYATRRDVAERGRLWTWTL